MICWPNSMCLEVISESRTISAKQPPSRKAQSTPTRYITPMRLWSSVPAQLMKPVVSFR